MAKFIICLTFLSLYTSNAFGTYVPPTYNGAPVTMGVTTLDPPDFTGKPVYRIEFTLESEDENGKFYPQGFIHRYVNQRSLGGVLIIHHHILTNPDALFLKISLIEHGKISKNSSTISTEISF